MARRKRFATWCREDPDDERKVNYTFTDREGIVHLFTSDNVVDGLFIRRLARAWIESIELKHNEFLNPEGEWFAVLYEEE